MSGTKKVLLIVGGIVAVFALVIVIGVAIVVSVFRKSEPTIRDNSLLTLRVAGSLPDYSPDDPFKKYFGGPDQSLTGLVMQFKKAKVDKRIKAILPLAPCFGQEFGEAGLAAVTVPTLIVGATDDESCPYDLDASYFFAHLGSEDRSLVTLQKRTHIMVIRETPLLMQYETAFFGLHLQGKTDYAQYLTPDTASTFRNVTLDVNTEES